MKLFFTKSIFFILFLIAPCVGFSQVFQFNFENSISPSIDNAVGTPSFTANGVTTSFSTSSPCQGSRMLYASDWDSNDYYEFAVNTTGYSNLAFSFCNRGGGLYIGNFFVRVSSDGGNNWTTVLSNFSPAGSNNTLTTDVFPASANDQTEVRIQIRKTGAAFFGDYSLDSATLTGVLSPIIESVSDTTACTGNTLLISGKNFTGTTAVTINNTAVSSFTVNSATSISATIASGTTTGPVRVTTATGTAVGPVVLVNPSPTSVSASASATTICAGTAINLSASATPNSQTSTVLIDENFNSSTNNWTTSGSPAAAAWTLRPNGYTYYYGFFNSVNFKSNDNSQFYLSNSDAGQATGSIILQSPSFSTVGLTSAWLTFYHYYRYNSNESANVEISTNGTNWTSLAAYTSTQGSSTNFSNPTISLNGYLNQPTLYVRFRYATTNDHYWAIDNVKVSGVMTDVATYSWTSNPAGFTSSVQNPTNVTPTANTTYTVTVTNNYGCSTTATTPMVNVTPVAGTGEISGATTVCSGTNSTVLTLSGQTGSIQWQSSSDNVNFTDITGATSAIFTATNLTATTYYRVMVSGSCSTAASNSVAVTVSPVSVAGAISGATTVCSGINSTALTLSGYLGTIQWQSSTDNFNFSDIENATSAIYTANNLTQTTYYRAVVSSGVCSEATTFGSAAITVNPVSQAGTIAGGCTVCQGSNATLTLSGYLGNIQWQSSSDNISFTDIEGATSATYIVQNVTATTYFRAVITSGICSVDISQSVTVTTGSATTWDGTAWSNGTPTSVDTAFITGNYTSAVSGNITACTLSVSNHAQVVIAAGNAVTLNGALTVEDGSMLTLENNANLLQTADAENTGEIIVKRRSSKLKRLDYTLWSSPVDGQNLQVFSPATQASRFYIYNTATNVYNGITPSANSFETGKGYLIRMPNNHPTWASHWNGEFRGVPHNGDYNINLADAGEGLRFNLVGNPYPSPISVEAFVEANPNITGTLYFWRKTNNAASPSYCAWKEGTFIDNGEAQVFDPQGVIRTGQGFFVEANGNGSSVTFNNAMRVNDNNNQFFRQSASVEKSRIWLNATNEAGAFSQMALVYAEDALSGAVDKYDARHINDGEIALNSMIDGVDYVIQGRSTFTAADVVPLKFNASAAGTYTIAIDHLDGLFAQGQPIFLKDNLTGAQHDLNASPYVFTVEAGISTGRFEVIYQLPLGINPVLDQNQVVIYKQGNEFVVNTGEIVIDSVEVYDIRGRQVVSKKNVNAQQVTFDPGNVNQVLIVKVTSDTNQTVTKKVIN